MATGDRFILTIRGSQDGFGADIDNVFAFEQVAGGGGAAALNNAFAGPVCAKIREALSVAYNMQELYTINVDDLADFSTLTIDEPGEVGGEVLPPFMAWAFTYQRTTRAVNNGRKAFSPIGEASINGGNATAEALIILEALAGLLTVSQGDLDGNEWSPRLWKRPGTYSTGVVAAPGAFYSFGNVVYARVSTQNTRKS